MVLIVVQKHKLDINSRCLCYKGREQKVCYHQEPDIIEYKRAFIHFWQLPSHNQLQYPESSIMIRGSRDEMVSRYTRISQMSSFRHTGRELVGMPAAASVGKNSRLQLTYQFKLGKVLKSRMSLMSGFCLSTQSPRVFLKLFSQFRGDCPSLAVNLRKLSPSQLRSLFLSSYVALTSGQAQT